PRPEVDEDDHPGREEESPDEAARPGAQVVAAPHPRDEARVEGERGEERQEEAPARQEPYEGEEGSEGEEPAHRAPPAGPKSISPTRAPGSASRAQATARATSPGRTMAARFQLPGAASQIGVSVAPG